MSRRRDEVLAPEVLVSTFVSPEGLVAAGEKVTVLCKRRLAFLIIPLLLPAVGFHVLSQ